MSVYPDHDPDRRRFRAGSIVDKTRLAPAEGRALGDVTPTGEIAYFRHVDPYAGLRGAYAEVMAHLAAEGRPVGMLT